MSSTNTNIYHLLVFCQFNKQGWVLQRGAWEAITLRYFLRLLRKLSQKIAPLLVSHDPGVMSVSELFKY